MGDSQLDALREAARQPGPPQQAITRDETLRALKERAIELGRPPRAADIQEVPRLYRGVLVHFGTVEAARKAARIAAPTRGSKWNETSVIAEVRRLHRQGVRLTVPALREAGHDGVVSAAQMFGGIGAMRRRARVPEPPTLEVRRTSWDEDRVTSEILQREKRREPLASSKAPSSLVGAARKYFGTWQAAIEAAGLDYDKVRLVRRWSADAIRKELRALRRARPDMTRGELYATPVGAALLLHFDDLDAALAAASISNWPARVAAPMPSRAETVDALRERHAAGKSMRHRDMLADDHRLVWAVARHFPSLRAALDAADVPNPFPRRRWSKENVLRELRRRIKHGSPTNPTAVVAEKHGNGLYKAARRWFRSWERALAAAAR